jgi:tetratricopeptide (TPR) repeat protein
MLSLSWMLVLLAAVFVALRGRRWPVTAFGLGTFVAVLAPASLIATMAWYGLGRYLYLPIAVLAPGLADAGTRLMSVVEQRSQRAALLCRVASVAYLAVFGVRLFASTWSWDGPLAFYESIIAEAPEASHGHGGLGKYLLERGALPRGTRELELAVQLAPLDSRYLNNLGVAYLRSGRRAEAQRAAELGIQRFPREAAKFANLRTLVEARP